MPLVMYGSVRLTNTCSSLMVYYRGQDRRDLPGRKGGLTAMRSLHSYEKGRIRLPYPYGIMATPPTKACMTMES